MSIYQNYEVVNTITQWAVMLGLSVLLAFPGIYFFSTYSYEIDHLEEQVALAASDVSQLSYAAPELWMYQEARIKDLLATSHFGSEKFIRVLDEQGEVVAVLNEEPKRFVLKRSADISDGSVILGQVEMTVDMDPVFIRTGVALALGMVIAVLLYLVLKTLPIRALRGALDELSQSNDALEDEAMRREHLIEELEAKNGELERFTYTVSHDLKSPLITIRGFIGLLEKDVKTCNAERVAEDTLQIKRATEDMQQLLDDLLELSRVGRVTNPAEVVNLNQLMAQAIEHVTGRIRSNNVEVIVADDLPTVYCDKVRLLEVVQNLLDNAVKFINHKQPPRVEINGWSEGDEVGCCIKDNGIGIDPRYHEKVFGLFERLDNTTEGTGIGLALVKRIIEVHEGRIWVESEGVNQGTCFCFTLPKPPGAGSGRGAR